MEESNKIAISIDHVTKLYPGRAALNDISFVVKKGSIHGFLGPNGAGKSTTMKIISGLIPPTSGEFKLDGRVGFLPEHPPLYPNMSVSDYLKFVREIYQAEEVGCSTVIDVMIKTGLSSVKNRLIGNLSKGYQQRVGIAQAIVHSPEIIILDEPTVGLDPVAISEIRELIRDLKQEHTILFSSHQLHDVELLCSDITLINQGRIVISGELSKIVENLKTRLSLSARVEQFNDQIASKMKSDFSLEKIDYRYDFSNKNYQVSIVAKAPEKLKKELAKFLCDDQIGLLEFAEIKLDLEELFKQMIQ